MPGVGLDRERNFACHDPEISAIARAVNRSIG